MTKKLVLGLVGAALAWGQTPWVNPTPPGQDDGAYVAPSGVTFFDPVALNYDKDGDNVFYFQSLTIPAGSTLILQASRMRMSGPVVFVVNVNVLISGVIDMSGGTAGLMINGPQPIPGPGGFGAGQGPGAPGVSTTTHTFATTSAPEGTCPAVHAVVNTTAACIPTTAVYGSATLLPLVGGSGGANTATQWGGAGAGAIRIVAAGSIVFSAASLINFQGGFSTQATSGSGSGGAVHLVATTIDFSSATTAKLAGGPGGRVRLDGVLVNYTAAKVQASSVQTFSQPTAPIPLPKAGSLQVRIGGNTVPATADASLDAPDVTFSGASALVEVTAKNIPVGTSIKMVCRAPNGNRQDLDLGNLTGTFDASNTSATHPIQGAISRCSVSAQW